MGNQRVTTNISTGDVEIITGVGDLLAENNLSDVDSAATSRTNLGLEIGTDVQEWSAELDTLASLTPTQYGVIIGDGADFVVDTTPQVAELLTPSVQATTSAGLSLQNSGGTTVATLGAGVGTGTTLAGGLTMTGSISGATISGASNTITNLEQSAVTGLTSALNARAMAGGVYLDGTGTGIFRDSVTLVDSVLTFTADITLDEGGNGIFLSQGGNSGGWFISIAPSGQIQFIAKQTGSTLNHFIETSNDSLEASRSYHVAVVVDFTTAARDVTFYVDGEPFASTTDVAATGTYGESPPRNFGIGARDLGGSPSIFFKGTISNAAAFNTALTADQISEIYEQGIQSWIAMNPEYRWGAAIALTSGTLEVGQRYRINTFVAGDDFTNVGGTNVTGNEFTATGTTPTTWTNSSELEAVGAVVALPMDDGNGPDLRDISGNGNNALLSETGYAHLKPKWDGSLSRAAQDFSSSGLWIGARALLPDNSYITGALVDGQWISPAAISQNTARRRIYVTNTAGALTFSRTSGTSAGTTVLSITPSDDSDVDITIYWKTVSQ